MKPAMRKLLDTVLERQAEPEQGFDDLAFIADVRETLSRGAPLSDTAKQLVWTSPTARGLYQRLRRDAADAARRRWTERGRDTQIERRAADSAEESSMFAASGFTVRLSQNAATGKWLVTLQLTPDAMEDLPSGISVRLRDKSGRIWIEGPLDRFGGRDAFWEDDSTTPGDELGGQGLFIEFY